MHKVVERDPSRSSPRSRRALSGAVVVACAVLAAMLSWIVNASAGQAAAPKRGGALTIDIPLMITGANPYAKPWDPGSSRILPLIYDGLVAYVPGKNDPVPSLASSWTVSKNGLTYTFNLRKNVKFSNGDPLTTSDVLFSLKQWKVQGDQLGTGCCIQIRQFKAVGSNKVQILMKGPSPTMVQYLASAVILDRKHYAKVGPAEYRLHPVGTGPWVVASFAPGLLKVKRNPRYWRPGKPYLDSLTVKTVIDANTRILDVRSGRAHVATEVPYSQAKNLSNLNNAKLLVTPWTATYVGQFNSQSGPISETPVRRALSYATNRAAIVATSLGGVGVPANSISVAAGDWNPKIKQLPYDLEAAKRELAKSSVPKGFPLKISIQTGDPTAQITAAILQDSFKKIGVDATIQATDPATFIADTIAGKYELQVDPPNWWVSPIPQVDLWYTYTMHPGPQGTAGFTWYKNPASARLVDRLKAAVNPTVHRQLSYQLQQISVDDPPLLSFSFLRNLTLKGNNVCGFAVPLSTYLYSQADTYLGRC